MTDCHVIIDFKVDVAAVRAGRVEGFCETHSRPYSECPQPPPQEYPTRGGWPTDDEIGAPVDEGRLVMRKLPQSSYIVGSPGKRKSDG